MSIIRVGKILIILLIASYCLMFSQSSFAFENLFYTLRGTDLKHLQKHLAVLQEIPQYHNKINIIVSQAYYIDQYGTVAGSIDPNLLKIAQHYHIKVMPLLTNLKFSQILLHQFLQDPQAQQRTISTILQLCKQQHFYGIQVDFEHLNISDASAFTQFYQKLATTLHQHHFAISIAVIPVLQNVPPNTVVLARYNNWSGAYQLTKLAQYSDFVSLMTYDQNGGYRPGPVASINWVTKALKSALRRIPANKLSLGIPTYSLYFTPKLVSFPALPNTQSSLSLQNNNKQIMAITAGQQISYHDAQLVLHTQHLHLVWDKNLQISYTAFEQDDMLRFLFLEDYRSFVAKLELAKLSHLRGISVFRLGTEDPRIWQNL